MSLPLDDAFDLGWGEKGCWHEDLPNVDSWSSVRFVAERAKSLVTVFHAWSCVRVLGHQAFPVCGPGAGDLTLGGEGDKAPTPARNP